jgi:hypothetical protein
VKLSLRVGVASAFTLIGFLAGPAPSQAACTQSNGINTCTLFEPHTTSSVVNSGGFVGMAMGPTFTKLRVMFATNGQWQTPNFTISDIKVSGEGIASTLDFGSLSISPSSVWPDMASDPNSTSYINLSTSITKFDFSNNKISFVIPANVANITGNVSSISARLAYAYTITSGPNSFDVDFPSTAEGRVQSTALNAAPSPLPLLGSASAFAFSRRLRQRTRGIA